MFECEILHYFGEYNSGDYGHGLYRNLQKVESMTVIIKLLTDFFARMHFEKVNERSTLCLS